MKIYFFASFGRFDRLPAGGGQTAARRLWHTLEKLGYQIELYNRHRYYWVKKPIDRILILLFELLDPIWMFLVLLFKKRKNSVYLFMSYAGGLVYFDFLMTLAAMCTGHKKVMYLAGGMAMNYYKKKGFFYRWIFRKTMLMYNLVMCEGEVNVQLVKEITDGKTKTFYLPNFTEDGFAPNFLPSKPKDTINILYFGRICDNKKVLLTIEVFNKLCDKYDNLNCTIIGNGDKEYEVKVDKAISVSPHKNKFERYSQSSHDFIGKKMTTHHIYMFPSCEPCEGHSNALNEAMSWGLVPIVSDNNFLPSIVGDDMLVVKGYDSDDYVTAIDNLIINNLIEQKSLKMYHRVKANFTQNVVELKLNQVLSVL